MTPRSIALIEPTCSCSCTSGAMAAHAPMEVGDAGAKAAHRGQQPQGLVILPLAFGGEPKPGPPTAAQRQAEPGFQVFHVAADGAGADIELQFGGRHAAT